MIEGKCLHPCNKTQKGCPLNPNHTSCIDNDGDPCEWLDRTTDRRIKPLNIKDTTTKIIKGVSELRLSNEHGNIWATIRIAELPEKRLVRVEGIAPNITVITKNTKIEEEI